MVHFVQKLKYQFTFGNWNLNPTILDKILSSVKSLRPDIRIRASGVRILFKKAHFFLMDLKCGKHILTSLNVCMQDKKEVSTRVTFYVQLGKGFP